MRNIISKIIFNTCFNIHNVADASAINSIREFIKSQISVDGAFINRANKPDIYYTYFGLLSTLILNEIELPIDKLEKYFNQIEISKLSFIHLNSFIRSKQLIKLYKLKKKLNFSIKTLLNILPNFLIKNKNDLNIIKNYYENSSDAKFPVSDKLCPYSLFLLAGTIEDCGGYFTENFLSDIHKYYIEKKGYTNIEEGISPSLNATVAAVMLIKKYTKIQLDIVSNFIKNQQLENGGFIASPGSASADLLSTSTSLLALNVLKLKPKYSPKDFIHNVWQERGGFSGTIYDKKPDVEYTFYGILSLGALA